MVRVVAVTCFLGAVAFVAGRAHHRAGDRAVYFSSDLEPAAGRFLVSSTKLSDPNFRRSVVLLVASDPDKGALGVIINRRSKVSLSRVFPDIKGPNSPKDLVFMGGPVELATAQALLRSVTPSGTLKHVLGDVYSTGDKDLIEKSISSGTDPAKFRVYLGYAGWAPNQLEAEIELGAWYVTKASPDEIFDEDPDSLWPRLSRKADTEIARDALPTGGIARSF
jgi:putative transcriptional regulator